MKIWKKNLTAAAVLVTVCAGIYLNWMYTEGSTPASLTDTLDEEKILDESMLVMSDTGALQEAAAELADTATDYFAAVRLSRQEARDSAVELLQEAMSYDTDTEKTGHELEELVDCMKVLTALDSGEGAATPAAPDGLREDRPIPSMDRAELLASAPAHDGESYLVPRTVG